MKTATLKKAIEKIGLSLEVKENWGHDLVNFQTKDYEKVRRNDTYICIGRKYRLEWTDDKGEADCVHLCPIGEQRDISRDYFPGYFCHTIKSAIRGLQA